MKYTIIITIYNKEKFLEKAIISACSQNYKNYTVIVVNDGSTDNSEKLILKLKDRYNFIYYKKRNTGIADTRNYAIKKVKTPYFIFLDADDYIEKDLLQEIDKYNDYDILSFNALKKDENDNIIKYINKPEYSGSGEEYIRILIKDNNIFPVPWGYVFNTNFYRKNKYQFLKGEILEDFELIPFVIADSKKVTAINYYGYNYITNSKSITNDVNNYEKVTNTFLKLYKIMFNRIDNSNYNYKTKKDLKIFVAKTIIWSGHKLNGKAQKEYMKKTKELKALNYANKNVLIRFFSKILYNLNIYYHIRDLYHKIFKK